MHYPRLSIIVPVFNVEKYIAKCLDSLVNQTLQDIEIICVDDCSSDKSVSIIKKYMKKDKRIRLICHPQNKGLAATRNTGLKSAKAELVTFVDSDDYLELNAYEKAIKVMTSEIDIVCFGIETSGNISSKRKKMDDEYYAVKYSGSIKITDNILFHTDVSSCNKIFRKSIIDKYAISFPDGLRYEDAYFFNVYGIRCQTAFFMKDKLYHYVRHENSIMSSTFMGEIGVSIDHVKIAVKLYEYLKCNNLFAEHKNHFYRLFFAYVNFSLYHEKTFKGHEQIYDLAINFLDKEKISLNNSSEFSRDYQMLKNRILCSTTQRYMKFIKIKRTASKKVYYVFGIPVLRIKYKIDKTKYYILFIPTYTINERKNKITHKLFGLKLKLLKKSKNNINTFMDRIDPRQNEYDIVDNLIIINNEKFTDKFLIDSFLHSDCVLGSNNFETLSYLFKNGNVISTYGEKSVQRPKYAFVWGSGCWYPQTETMLYALKMNIPLLKFEDGFLKSADTWCSKYVDKKYTEGISFTITDNIFYFDATRASHLEILLNDSKLILTEQQIKRAKDCINKIVTNYLTKYNHQPIYTPDIGRKNVKKVLVVDQSYGDMSIAKGWGSEKTFDTMLNEAILQNPGADIIIKTHPDTLAKGTNRSGYYTEIKSHDNVYVLTDPINPIALVQFVDKVYVCTTQLGFEALMCGKEVHTYGMPFYAGWGLTIDKQKCERRTNIRTLEEIFYIAYIIYSFYVNPLKKCRCEIEEAIEYLLNLREDYFLEYNIKREK